MKSTYLYRHRIYLCLLLLFVQATHAWQEAPAAEQQDTTTHTIYVSSISWHTGVVVPTEIIPDSLWREGHTYEGYNYLEIGWGEADFYPHDSFNVWYALKSAFWPTASVIHIAPIRPAVEKYYYDTDVVKMEIDAEGFANLRDYLVNSFELDHDGKIIPAAPGKYAESHFYEARETYYFPKNSNVWAARALKRAGFSISPIWHQTTGQVIRKAESFGEKVVEER